MLGPAEEKTATEILQHVGLVNERAADGTPTPQVQIASLFAETALQLVCHAQRTGHGHVLKQASERVLEAELLLDSATDNTGTEAAPRAEDVEPEAPAQAGLEHNLARLDQELLERTREITDVRRRVRDIGGLHGVAEHLMTTAQRLEEMRLRLRELRMRY